MLAVTKLLGHTLFAVLVLAGSAWAVPALWLHLSGLARAAALMALAGAAGAVLVAWFAQHPVLALAGLALAAGGVAGWYRTITPAEDRDWEIEVSRGVIARQEGEIVTLSNLRDFEWRSPTEATARWTTRRCDLRQLASVDMLTSVWDRPDIAHLLVSFGFADCGQIVFSVEIRREKGEKYNELGGFYRQFEQVLIGATEDDIVKLRTNFRREQVRLYPVRLAAAQRRTLFLSYLDLARQLEEKPRFYNTLTANCTTTVWGLAHSLAPDLPLDRRLILSGRLPDYLTDLGVIDPAPAAARDAAALITPRAQTDDGRRAFSDLIRQR